MRVAILFACASAALAAGGSWVNDVEKWRVDYEAGLKAPRVEAKWVAYPEPKKIAILNILGMTSEEPSPGYAEFHLNGARLRLQPVIDEGQLFFMFKDRTAGEATYPAGRFLYTAIPSGAVVDLDFNKAKNPHCAFTAFATCPLPPKANSLPVAIEAGEKRYGKH